MGSRRFEITIVSAEGLPDVRRLGRMKVYAEVSLNGSTKATPTDRERDTSPRWDFPLVYNINESKLERGGLDVVVDLYCERTLGDRLLGRVVIPMKSLLEKGLKSQKSLSYPISGTSYGRLYIGYCFEEKFVPQPSAPRGGVAELDRKVSRLAIVAEFDHNSKPATVARRNFAQHQTSAQNFHLLT